MFYNDEESMEKALRQIIRSLVQEPEIRKMVMDELKRSLPAGADGGDVPGTVDSESPGCIKIVFGKKGYKLYLPEYNAEIKLGTWQAKALYIFYLLCPDGVSNSELVEYKDCIKKIYEEIYHKECDNIRKEYIDRLLEKKNRLNDVTNKIRRSLKNTIKNDDLLKYYIIDGPRGGKRCVLLPKEKIKIENSENLKLIGLEIDVLFKQKEIADRKNTNGITAAKNS